MIVNTPPILYLYNVDLRYIVSLHDVDERVYLDKDRLDTYYGKPYGGPLQIFGRNFYAPFTMKKEKHHFWKDIDIKNGNFLIYNIIHDKSGERKDILSALVLKYMIPVPDCFLTQIDISKKRNPVTKDLLTKESDYLNTHSEEIKKSVRNVYFTSQNLFEKFEKGIIDYSPNMCNFKLLEKEYDKYISH